MSELLSGNMIKYYNYKEQMGRLKKALLYEFYLEAIFIEYAIMEDRTEAILRYEGNECKSQNIGKKLNKIKTISRDKKALPGKYFDDALVDRMMIWKDKRNTLIHALVKQQLKTEELKALAEEGNELVKELNRRSQNYKREVERKIKKENDEV